MRLLQDQAGSKLSVFFFMCPVTCWDVESRVAQSCVSVFPLQGRRLEGVDGAGAAGPALWRDSVLPSGSLLFPPLHAGLLLKATEQVCQGLAFCPSSLFGCTGLSEAPGVGAGICGWKLGRCLWGSIDPAGFGLCCLGVCYGVCPLREERELPAPFSAGNNGRSGPWQSDSAPGTADSAPSDPDRQRSEGRGAGSEPGHKSLFIFWIMK